ncbi:alpha/beta fold hydrolase [Nucisporomicrobium flavum]|uniref:alpha/beta fold hydrolase n=1 Tax=Nucisporomicrobium flavum TaxID=2785915 RepID=UPI003C2D7C31
MRRITVGTLSCLVSGDGPPLVFLHGLAGSAGEAPFGLPGHRVIAPDQRGHGRSERRPEDLSRAAYVRDVVTVIETLAGGGPVALAGQSMGAHTAMLTAAWHPGLVSRLIMLEGGVGGSEDDYPTRLGTWFASWPVPFPTRTAAAEFLGGTPFARALADDLAEGPDGYRPRFDADIMEGAIRPVAEHARWDEWAQINTPTLLVRAEHSRLPDAEVQRMVSLRPDIEVATIPLSTHDAHLDRPGEWVTLITEFLARA